MRHIRMWVYDGVFGSSVAGPLDVFTAANAVWRQQNRGKADVAPLFEWRVESPNGQAVRTASGHALAVDGRINPRTSADVAIVPGPFTGGVVPFLERLQSLRENLQPLFLALRAQHERGGLVASFCSGSFLLAEAGLLDGHRATTHWALADAFRQRYPRVDLRPGDVLTEHGRILCSGAVTSYFALALRLVEKFGGADLAAATAKLLLIDTSRISQASYATLTLQDRQPHSDRLVAKAQAWMQERLDGYFRLSELARALAVSERTLNRRFKQATAETPIVYLQSLRVEVAKRLLETSGLNLDAVCERVGYGDSSTFRRLFKRATGLTPGQYRHRFARRTHSPSSFNHNRRRGREAL